MAPSILKNSQEQSELKYLYCDSCNSLLPASGLFCVQCDPPEGPILVPEGELTFPQAMLRIALLILLFLTIAIFKLDINVIEVLSNNQDETKIKVTEDEDFKIVFKVNAVMANIRSLPNIKTSTIIDKIPKSTQVMVNGVEGDWSRIKYRAEIGANFKTGWIATRLLDSEIK